jgi:hypothetical protein
MIITQASFFDLAKEGHQATGKLKKRARLRPWAPLQRLWPVRLTAIKTQLQNCQRAVMGLRLVEQYFPEALDQYGDLAQTTWWDILVDLANRVEDAGWFEIDWDGLNEAWAAWLEQADENGDHLATFLRYIPIRLYGFTREPAAIPLFQAEPGLYLEFFPPMELLYVLLDPTAAEISSGLRVAAELFDVESAWDELDREAAWERLHAIEAEPAAYPELARRLPVLAKWACGCIDNPILKWSFAVHYQDNGPRFAWDTDVDQARSAWQAAKPMTEHLDQWLVWCRERAENLVSLAEFLTTGKNVERLTF